MKQARALAVLAMAIVAAPGASAQSVFSRIVAPKGGPFAINTPIAFDLVFMAGVHEAGADALRGSCFVVLDFGDGDVHQQVVRDLPARVTKQYAAPGRYTVQYDLKATLAAMMRTGVPCSFVGVQPATVEVTGTRVAPPPSSAPASAPWPQSHMPETAGTSASGGAVRTLPLPPKVPIRRAKDDALKQF